MDNLSRTRDDLKSMSVDYLKALKAELEEAGTQKLVRLDNVEADNRKLMLCLKNLKYVPKEVMEAQKAEKTKQQEKQKAERQRKKEAQEAARLKREALRN